MVWKETFDEGLAHLRDQAPGIVLVDYQLGPRTGVEFASRAQQLQPGLPVVLMTALSSPSVDEEALRAGIADILDKQRLTPRDLTRSIRYTLNRERSAHIERRFRSLIENSNELIADLRPDGSLKYLSPSITRVLGFSQDEKLGADAMLEVHPDDRSRVEDAFGKLATNEVKEARLRYRVLNANDEWRMLDTVASNHLHDPDINGIIANSWDVTEHHHSEQELRFKSRLLETVGEAIIATDLAGSVTYWNDVAEKLYGWSSDEAIGQDIVEMTSQESNEEQARAIMDKLSRGKTWRGELEVRRKDDSKALVLVTNAPITDEFGRNTGIIGISSDITHLKRTEAALRERVKELKTLHRASSILYDNEGALEDRLSRLIEIVPLGWVHPDVTEARLVIGNSEYATPRFEVTEWMQTVDLNLSGTDARLEIALLEERPERDEGPFLTEERELLGSLAEIIANSVTRQRFEEGLRRSQKIEAVGRLAGGIAHDFNNLLTVISASSQLLGDELGEHSQFAEDVEIINSAADRAAELTGQLLAFSRDQILRARVVDVRKLIGNLSALLSRVLGETIAMEVEVGDEPLPVYVDPSQFEQVLVNLAVNARDAMPTGGKLTFVTGLDASRENVRIEVADSGHGMDEATRERIFDPFFTSKPVGQGTGLGLAMAYGFIHQSGGTIEVESSPGEGTTFTLLLPLTSEEAETPAAIEPVEDSAAEHVRVLVVEDNPQVARIVQRILERSGSQAELVADVASARELLHSTEHDFDILVSDLILPGESGRSIIEWVRQNRPDVGIIAMSGYSQDSAEIGQFLRPDLEFLQKPFTPDELLETLHRVLAARSPGATLE